MPDIGGVQECKRSIVVIVQGVLTVCWNKLRNTAHVERVRAQLIVLKETSGSGRTAAPLTFRFYSM